MSKQSWRSPGVPVVPTVVVVEVESLSFQRILKQALQHCVVWLLLKLQCPAVDEQLSKLVDEVLAQPLDRNRQLLLHDLLVLLLLVVRLEVLPRDGALDEVKKYISNAFDIVAASLLDAKMGVEGGEACSSCQVLVVFVGDVRVIFEKVLLGESEVDHVDFAGLFTIADHEVVGFDVPVDESLVMDVLNSLHHLITYHQGSFQVKLLPSQIEQIFQGFPTEVHYHHVVLPLASHVVDVGEAVVGSTIVALQGAQDLSLVEQLGAFCVAFFEFDGILGVVLNVEGEEDLPESA